MSTPSRDPAQGLMARTAFVSTFLPSPLVRPRFIAHSVSLRSPNRTFCPASVQPAQMSISNDGKKRNLVAKIAAVAMAALLIIPIPAAFAASSGGRIGGSSFRSTPRIQRSAPRAGYRGGGYGYGGGYGGGGGVFMPIYMNPFLFPMVGGGGLGGLGTIVLAGTAIALISQVGRAGGTAFASDVETSTSTAVVTLKIGLLASARGLQTELDGIARAANTSSAAGLQTVLQETAVALLRHPDYWVYGSSEVSVPRAAEAAFNDAAVAERVKIKRETLSNVRGRKVEIGEEIGEAGNPQEFIVVTLIVAADRQLVTKMPKGIYGAADVRRALQVLGAVPATHLQGLELLWAPQRRSDVLTKAEMLLDHPELKAL